MKLYKDAYKELIELFENISDHKEYGNLTIYKYQFESGSQDLLPGAKNYCCHEHNEQFDGSQNLHLDIGTIDNKIQIHDTEIHENKKFDYFVFVPNGQAPTNEAIFLFHGFNEKNWNKYLTWALFIAEDTGFPVILFPMAFHMNRTLSIWSDKRKMFLLSEKRRQMFPDVVNSSLTNVAISMRLHSRPQRFIWSGLQSYYDLISFIDHIRKGEHPLFAAETNFNIVAYSIGNVINLSF